MKRSNRNRRKAAEKLRKKGRGKWQEVDLRNTPIPSPGWMTEAFRNNYYTVMVSENQLTSAGNATRVMIQAHDNLPIKNHWRELQRIKNELFGEDCTAIEYYPPQDELIDEQNIYWLWIFPEGVIPKIYHSQFNLNKHK